ncbi:tail fiber assembly protein [Collimonas sp. NPDC087041]|uniref:tail fiber assembly protein n=1 Tax=Collimonas sp. NPDC087041 TaxID=3363960 RepID=UPI0038035CDC
MRYFIDPISSGIFAFDVEATAFIETAIEGGYVECGRAPTEDEAWDFSAAKWVVDPEKVAANFKAKAKAYTTAKRAMRDQLLTQAGLAIDPLQDAIDLDVASAAEIALLKKWKQYRVAVNRLCEQSNCPDPIDWPVSPVDLDA